MDEVVPEDHPCHKVRQGLKHCLPHLCGVLLLDELRQGNPFGQVRGEDRLAGKVHGRHEHAGDALEVLCKLLEVLGLNAQVHLLHQIRAEVVDRALHRQPLQPRPQTLGSPSSPAQQPDVRVQQSVHSRTPHLHGNCPGGSVCGLQLASVDLCYATAPQQVPDYEAGHCLFCPAAVARGSFASYSLVECAHGIAELRGQDVPARREPLRELHEDRAAVLQGRHDGLRVLPEHHRHPYGGQVAGAHEQPPARPGQQDCEGQGDHS
mmetsp:Transcript_70009/g.226477  ORF Transcript_70009/g.226477 Transcript_70009/m.226477 type:complete len:264 (+) Transcript_70009:701-1492(+)